MKFFTKIIFLAVFLQLNQIVLSYSPHCDHHHLHSHVVVQHNHYDDLHFSDHIHVGDTTIHGHLTNVAPSSRVLVNPGISIIINNSVSSLPSRHVDVVYPVVHHHHVHYTPVQHCHNHVKIFINNRLTLLQQDS
jgi:hypothetical protein